MSIKSPIIMEKIATPKSKIRAHMSLSGFDLGWKSPNPTVEREVKAK